MGWRGWAEVCADWHSSWTIICSRCLRCVAYGRIHRQRYSRSNWDVCTTAGRRVSRPPLAAPPHHHHHLYHHHFHHHWPPPPASPSTQGPPPPPLRLSLPHRETGGGGGRRLVSITQLDPPWISSCYNSWRICLKDEVIGARALWSATSQVGANYLVGPAGVGLWAIWVEGKWRIDLCNMGIESMGIWMRGLGNGRKSGIHVHSDGQWGKGLWALEVGAKNSGNMGIGGLWVLIYAPLYT